MKIESLMRDVKYKKVLKTKKLEIAHITDKSDEVQKGSAFICLNGLNTNGHNFAKAAEANGASAIICEHKIDGLKIPQFVCEDTRKAMAIMAGNFYNNPASKMKMVAITGTNGKTTTSYLIKSILEEDSESKVGLIGTTANYIGDIMLPPKLTTPDPIDLHKLLAKMEKAGCTHVVMEASAHALALNKLAGITFDVGVFTNLTQDHLDFFKTMDNYGKAKQKLFTPQLCKRAIINIDDEFGKTIAKETKVPIFTYGMSGEASVHAEEIESNVFGSKFKMLVSNVPLDTSINLPGKFNVYNALAGSAACLMLGSLGQEVTTGLENVDRVEGRFNTMKSSDGVNVVIDYAHTPDGVLNILNTVKSLTKGRTISVFGCGGNRDKTKRSKMGNIASGISDYSIITSDNPRFEKPETIINEIEKGMCNSNYTKITDRKAAIRTAIDMAKTGDTIAILGKGAEDYQEINGIKYHFKDEEEVNLYLDFKAKVEKIEKQNVVNARWRENSPIYNNGIITSDDGKIKIKASKPIKDDIVF